MDNGVSDFRRTGLIGYMLLMQHVCIRTIPLTELIPDGKGQVFFIQRKQMYYSVPCVLWRNKTHMTLVRVSPLCILTGERSHVIFLSKDGFAEKKKRPNNNVSV